MATEQVITCDNCGKRIDGEHVRTLMQHMVPVDGGEGATTTGGDVREDFCSLKCAEEHSGKAFKAARARHSENAQRAENAQRLAEEETRRIVEGTPPGQ